jgi:lysylphosphatidylglycerol synthetase-like protein (DUF2156 family)
MATKIAEPELLWKPADLAGSTSEPAAMRAWVDRYGLHPLAVLPALNGGELFVHGGLGGVGFFRWRRGVLAVGGALTAERDHRAVLSAFLEWCSQHQLKPRFVHLPAASAEALAALGFKIDQLGASYSLAFDGGDLPGRSYQQVRRKLNAAWRAGVTVERVDAPRYAELLPQLREINRQWLRQKGAKHIRLLVCEFDRIAADADTRIYVASHHDRVIAYLVFNRTLGADAGWFHNLSRRATGCVDGTMQLIVSTFMREVGHGTLHFGFTPLVELVEPAYPHDAVATWIARQLARRGGVVYPARSQRQYKVSWCPTGIAPEYFAYRGSTLGAMIWFLRATNSV